METGAKVFKEAARSHAFAVANESWKPYRNKKTKAASICITLMKLALRLIPPFPTLGKSPIVSSSCLLSARDGSMC